MAAFNGYNSMMSQGHHFSCAHSFALILSADVVRVTSVFSVVIDVIIKIRKILFNNIREYAYA